MLLHVKNSTRPPHWWGMTFTVFKKLASSTQDWWLVLLVREGKEAYVLNATQVKGIVSGLSRNDLQYIFHEGDAASGLRFKTWDDLFQQLLS
jgi:hypothetical protein